MAWVGSSSSLFPSSRDICQAKGVKFRVMYLVKVILQFIHLLEIFAKTNRLGLGSSGLGKVIPQVIHTEDTNKRKRLNSDYYICFEKPI